MPSADYRPTYSRMSDDEILRLALDPNLLRDEARVALTSELFSRGLTQANVEEYRQYLAATAPFDTSRMLRETGNGLYAGFWQRVIAFLIDAFVVGVPAFVLSVFLLLILYRLGLHGAAVISYMIFGIVLPWLYEAMMESSRHEATLGKRALGIRVVDLEGRRITFARGTGRHFAKLLSAIPLNFGFLMVASTERKQALHDSIAGTVVVRGAASAASDLARF